MTRHQFAPAAGFISGVSRSCGKHFSTVSVRTNSPSDSGLLSPQVIFQWKTGFLRYYQLSVTSASTIGHGKIQKAIL